MRRDKHKRRRGDPCERPRAAIKAATQADRLSVYRDGLFALPFPVQASATTTLRVPVTSYPSLHLSS